RDHPTAIHRADLSRTLDRLGLLAIPTRPDEARASLEQAVGLQRELLHQDQDVPESGHMLAMFCNHLGIASRALGRTDVAQASFEEAVATLKVLSRDHPDVPRYRSLLANVHHNLGNLQVATGRPEARA